MKAFIVYCHPSEDSFTRHIRDEFIGGILDSGNEYEISDLYKMGFKTDMTEEEYLRDAYYKNTPDIAKDVLAEHQKINSSDAIVFIYPVFWSDAPAKLVGWFDRVWSYGFAYGDRTMKTLGQHRTTNGGYLCTPSTCKFSVILPKFTLKYVSIPAANLANLTKNLTACLTYNGCAVLPLKKVWSSALPEIQKKGLSSQGYLTA
ncbi:NAD(P)H-dependent oxidoreductase [Ruminococcus sp. NK3A76]|uniref:NAD(P)H-dependent oxidoreductase n=1 Tax=Ruminococcus sp. NK3A76 TaxID=877411 RepID=UPI000490FDB4|nr:NAD(P)H-dependent oxidoreductase [Ruminococcus sp. NK3A76]